MVKWWVRHEDEMEDEERETGDSWWKCRVLYMVEGEMFWYILEIESAAATNSKEQLLHTCRYEIRRCRNP